MKLSCPCCGNTFPLEAGTNDADARRFSALMGELQPGVARLVISYLALFKPPKRGLSWSRRLALLEALVPEIREAWVTRNGVTRPAPAEVWISGLATVIEKPDLQRPLKTHGLLREIVASLAGRESGRQERQVEEKKVQRAASRPDSGPTAIGKVLDRAAQQVQSKRLKDSLKGGTNED